MEHITEAEFLALFPQFTSAPDEWIEALLNLCQTAAFNVCLWGSWLQMGEAYFIAHFLTLRYMTWGSWDANPDNPDSTVWMQNLVQSAVTQFQAGAVRYEKDAGLEGDFIKSPFMRTAYGQQLLALRNHLAVGLVMVT